MSSVWWTDTGRVRGAADGRMTQDAYASLYYPGTIDAGQAIALAVEPGADLHGIDFHMVRTHAVRVRGRVSGPTGLSTRVSQVRFESRIRLIGYAFQSLNTT